MDLGLIASRYAKALDEYAVQSSCEAAVYAEAQQLSAVLPLSESLREVIASPVLPADEKIALLGRALRAVETATGEGTEYPGLDASLEPFLRLVIRHGREEYLPFMLRAYIDRYKRRHGLCDAELTTATPLSAATLERIRALAAERSGCEVQLHERVDPELLGGFLFRMEDEQIDATLRTQLRKIRRALGEKNNRIV